MLQALCGISKSWCNANFHERVAPLECAMTSVSHGMTGPEDNTRTGNTRTADRPTISRRVSASYRFRDGLRS